jgi:hypothetical protein
MIRGAISANHYETASAGPVSLAVSISLAFQLSINAHAKPLEAQLLLIISRSALSTAIYPSGDLEDLRRRALLLTLNHIRAVTCFRVSLQSR